MRNVYTDSIVNQGQDLMTMGNGKVTKCLFYSYNRLDAYNEMGFNMQNSVALVPDQWKEELKRGNLIALNSTDYYIKEAIDTGIGVIKLDLAKYHDRTLASS